MGTGASYRVVAYNTATASANKIHDDEVARRYGFAGGLVPGVDVYAYMTRPAAAQWGLDWLRRGTMRARFLVPVYEGEEVTVDATPTAGGSDDPGLAVELRNPAGTVCAVGEARLPETAATPPPVDTWPPTEPNAEPKPESSPESLAVGTVLALSPHRFHADQAPTYLAEVREELPVYSEHGVAHPGWLLRDANYVLSANVVLGPWIHVESVSRHFDLVRDGDHVEARATVRREWERKGHRFVELDVGLLVGGERCVAQVTHTAIYRPRPTD